jgi:uncharacterized protein (TIGR03643 family)
VKTNQTWTVDQRDRIIQMAWEDRTTFEAIQNQFGLSPGDVIKLMRRELKPSSFKLWRKRTTGRATKHGAKRGFKTDDFVAPVNEDSHAGLPCSFESYQRT